MDRPDAARGVTWRIELQAYRGRRRQNQRYTELRFEIGHHFNGLDAVRREPRLLRGDRVDSRRNVVKLKEAPLVDLDLPREHLQSRVLVGAEAAQSKPDTAACLRCLCVLGLDPAHDRSSLLKAAFFRYS
jgi:hypothetical protein